MTKEQLNKRIDELKPQVLKSIDNGIRKVLESGEVDMDNYADDLKLPKIVLAAALLEAESKINPNTQEDISKLEYLWMVI